jgi:multiple sugar transport system permease protein
MSASTASPTLPGSSGPVRTILGIVLAILLLFWTLLPIYNIILISLQSNDLIFSGNIWPVEPTIQSYITVFTQSQFYVEAFWIQLWNSLVVGVATALITLAIASLTTFAIARLNIRFGWMLSTAALLTYLIPATFLVIPFYQIMQDYGLIDNLWSVILVEVTFATPYAIFIFQQYSASIPREIDESAKIDGASTPQIFFMLFLPLMMPALVAVGTYALLLAWNEYIYAVILLSSERQRTLPVALGFFLSSDEAPWNVMMATAVLYSIPPLIIYYFFRGQVTSGLTLGSVKG